MKPRRPRRNVRPLSRKRRDELFFERLARPPRRGPLPIITLHPDIGAIRTRMIDWTRYRDSTPEERATLPRPLSPERLARRYGVSRRSLMRWWSKEVRTVLDAVCPSPGPTAVYQAIKAVQDLARTLRRPDLTLPVSYEHLEQRALAIFDRTSRDLPPEDRALLSALVSSGLLVFIAGMTEEGRALDREAKIQEGFILRLVLPPEPVPEKKHRHG